MQTPVKVSQAVNEVYAELQRARSLYGPFASPHEGYAVIKEELDELWEIIRGHGRLPGSLREEATQVAAMALRFMLDVTGE